MANQTADRQSPFESLLWLANQGIIPVRAATARFAHRRDIFDDLDRHDLANDPDWRELDMAPPSSREASMFFDELRDRHASKVAGNGHCSFATGSFKFALWTYEIVDEGRADYPIYFEVIGLMFGKGAVLNHFGLHQKSAENSEFGEERPKRKGRTKGSGSYEQLDQPLLEEMRALIASAQVASVEAAADAVADRAFGHSTPESRKTRLAKRYREQFGEPERSADL